ncbi:MAG: dienelactone hydrolase family protein [Rhizobiaceae bacterium]|nr:dienelactone hydrolase family protein [Rhizobiaceae bacterium]
MALRVRITSIFLILLVLIGCSTPASAMELVHLNSAKPPPSALKTQARGIEPEKGLPIWGHLSKPSGEGPFPALVLMHGCAGIHASHERWSKLLNELGYVTLILDSFRPRNIFSVCSTFSRAASPPLRALDAQGALSYLQKLDFVDANKVGVIGWSHGGMSALAAVTKHGIASRFKKRFKMAIAFYPYCYANQTSDIPILILIGESDDWTPLETCKILLEQSMKDQSPLQMVVYPRAYHAFDDPALGDGFYVDGLNGQRHFIQYNKSAHADAKNQVENFLAIHLSK